MSISILKSGLKTSLLEAFYNEILTNSNNYYYFLGKTLPWNGGDSIETPDDSAMYESKTRDEMILLKKVTSADVSYIIPRHDWLSGTVFDMYDDAVGTEYFISNATWALGIVTATSVGHGLIIGDSITILDGVPSGYNGTFTVTGTTTDTFNYSVAINPGMYEVPGTIVDPVTGKVTTIVGAKAVFCSTSNAISLSTSKFYCMTSDYHVYKCLDNNGGSPSTVKPYATSFKTLNTSDGYIWKYMYTVPVSSRNKFMTIYDIPVTTAIRNQYYAKGSINSTIVTSYGYDYEVGTELIVNGNGYLEANPARIVSYSIIDQGSGYSIAPTLTIEDPFTAGIFTLTTDVLLGSYLKYGNNIYQVVSAGTTGGAYPVHTSDDIVYNGTAGIKFVGITATAQAHLTADKVTSITFNGVVGYINMVSTGYGYSGNPIVTISDTGGGTNAVGQAMLNPEGRIVGVLVTNKGINYTTAVAVSFAKPMTETSSWSSGGTVAINDVILHGGNYYKVISGTTLGTSPPTHTKGTAANGTTQLQFIGQDAIGTVDLYYGYGYSATPVVTVTGTATTNASIGIILQNTKAKLTPIIENGQIVATISADPGIGYTTSSIDVIGAGSEAQIVPNLTVGDLNTNQATIELLAVPGTIDAIKVTNTGASYSSSITIQVVGDGTGCTASGTVINGKLTKVTILTPGKNYTKASVVITGTQGTNPITAQARAIVSPFDGHGKNAINELFAKDISLFSSISSERNQGFTVLNDYRQIGIIKNPQKFSNNLRYTILTGSACYSVSASYPGSDGSAIQLDDIITDSANSEFRVVARTIGSNSVTLLLQSLDNATVEIAKNLYFNNSGTIDTLIVTNYTAPSVNKYSGSILFIDNRNSFIPSTEQTVSIKTAIRL